MMQRVLAELIGTAFLLAAVVGSGIMGEALAGGNVAIALLANTFATGAALYTLIVTLGPISGAHFNPLVSALMVLRGDLVCELLPIYVIAQVTGAVLGVIAAHAMFDLPLLQLSTKLRPGMPLMFSEFVATAGLLGVVLLVSRQRPTATPSAVASVIMAAYWFTASTSFANPAVTLARALTNTFAGIRFADVPGFIGAQILAALLCAGLAYRQRTTAITSPQCSALP